MPSPGRPAMGGSRFGLAYHQRRRGGGLSFDNMRPQPMRTIENSFDPDGADRYADNALAWSKQAAQFCRVVWDIAYGEDYWQRLDLYLPPREELSGLPVLVFIHGGAWTHGYKEWMGFMAPHFIDLPAIFVSVSYRLAPEHKFPAPLDDCLSALGWVHENIAGYGADAGRIFVAGWSAGGTLAALVTLRRNLYGAKGLPPDVVKGCFPVSTSFDVHHPDPKPGSSWDRRYRVLFDRRDDDVLASPINYVEGNQTPFFITFGSRDPEEIQQTAPRIITALEKQGCKVEHFVFEGLDHWDMSLDHRRADNEWIITVRSWISRS